MSTAKERYKIIDGVEYCYCSKEDSFKKCSEFDNLNQSRTGYQYNCRECQLIEITFADLPNDDWRYKSLKEIFEGLGYNLNESIHKQFMKKHYE